MRRSYKRLAIPILMLSLMIVLTACGDKNSPEATVGSLFESVKSLDYETLETLVDTETKDGLEEDASGITEGLLDTEELEKIDFEKVEGFDTAKTNLKDILSDLSYKIVDTEETKNAATVTVEAEYVDGEELISNVIGDLFGEIMGQAFTNADDEMTEEEAMSLLAEIFNKNYAVFDKTVKKDTVSINLIKNEEGKWLISDIEEDLLNVLSFNMVEGTESVFTNMFEGMGDIENIED